MPSNIYVPTNRISTYIEEMMARYATQRKPHERRWYDNNFFDDGYHFQSVSRTTGKIVDTSSRAFQNAPKRAIPKASRQIRGVASLLLQLEPHPAIYPDRVNQAMYPPIPRTDEQTGQQVLMQNPELKKAFDKAKEVAKKTGYWVEEEWDDQDMDEKLIDMILLAAKQSISFLQIWPDAMSKSLASQVFDAFDIYLDGTLKSIYDSPSIIKAVPTLIDSIKSNEMFDEEQRERISPDNKYASSEIKQAYMAARFGQGGEKETQLTVILKECFMKEYVTEENVEDIREKQNGDVLMDKKMGDTVIRHTFSTSNGWLLDEYVDLPEYPFIDYRFEPGLIYQVPLIERFIPANKSLDIAVSRVEGYANTMVTGIYQKRKGENFKIANIPGGQVIEYEGTPLTQMQPTSVPGFMFNFINLLESFVEEQGASTSTLNQLPAGVKSGKAIESVKATEYANLKIPSMMFKKTVKRIAQRLIEQSADLLVNPKEVSVEEQGEASYFDVIGEKGVQARKEAGMEVDPEWIVLKKDAKVRVEIENGLGYTIEGKKQSMQDIANYMLQLAEAGMVSKEQIQVMLKRFLEIFQFGSTAEFMDALDGQQVDMTEQTIQQVKIAVLETLKDAGVVGPEADTKLVESTKLGTLEVLKETGMLNKPETKTAQNKVSINYKDLTPEGKTQAAALAGIDENPNQIVMQEVEQEVANEPTVSN